MTDSYEVLHKQVVDLNERAEREFDLFPNGGGSLNTAASFLKKASELEKRAFYVIHLCELDYLEKSRLYGVTAINSVVLLFRSGDEVGAKKLAGEFLNCCLPEFAVVWLRSIR